MGRTIGGGRTTRQWVLWGFKLQGCADCGIRPPDIPLDELDCDHRNPATKKQVASRSIYKTRDGLLGHSDLASLLDELLKCDVVCRACHHERTKARGRSGVVLEQMSLLPKRWGA